jgi:hypothetical protein
MFLSKSRSRLRSFDCDCAGQAADAIAPDEAFTLSRVLELRRKAIESRCYILRLVWKYHCSPRCSGRIRNKASREPFYLSLECFNASTA